MKIDLDPRNASAYNNRGIAYEVKRNFDQAPTDLNKATNLNPGLAAAYENRGYVYSQRGPKSQAIAEFETYLRLSRDASHRAEVVRSLGELKGQ